jgi:hypothetical protein
MDELFSLKDSRDFSIDIPKGYYMCLSFTTQAANRVFIKMYDEKKTYLDEERQSIEAEPIITKSGIVEGDKLKLYLNIPASSKVEVRKVQKDITGEDGELIARVIVILVEDYIDYDFNDVILSITAWKNKG